MPKKSPTILIADDDPSLLGVTAKVLRARGYIVLTAPNGEAALEVFEQAQHTIQLVISDVMMPRMRGPQLARSIKGISPSTAVLLMSGTWSNEAEDGVPLIPKPFTCQKLVAIVQDLLIACNFDQVEREQSVARSRRLRAIPGVVTSQTRHPLPAK
jgi:DNA-binding NtrC family response regulator